MTNPSQKRPERGARTATIVRRGRGAPDVGSLFTRIVSILEEARAQVVRSVNSAMVLAYWQIGREIVELHQRGSNRAGYGDQLLDVLSADLTARIGRGYSTTNLRYFRTFYLAYADRLPQIRHIEGGESGPEPPVAARAGARKIRHTPSQYLCTEWRSMVQVVAQALPSFSSSSHSCAGRARAA